MTGFYIFLAALIVLVLLCFFAKSKLFHVSGVLIAVLAGFSLPYYYLTHTKEIDDQSYIAVQEISSFIDDFQDQEAIQLRLLIDSSLADNKLTLSEFKEIGNSYNAYRSKYSLNK